MARRAAIRVGTLVLLAAGRVLGAETQAAGGQRGALHELLPHDTLAFADLDTGGRAEAGKGAGGAGLVDLGINALQSLGVLRGQAGMVADVLGLAGEFGGDAGAGRRSCIALLDADLAVTAPAGNVGPNDLGGAKLDCRGVQMVWILETDEPAAMVERLTRLLSHLSSRSTARQGVRQAGESKREFVEFTDTGWPAWAKLAWVQEAGGTATDGAAYGPRFVLAFGAGAMEHYLSDRPVADAPWRGPLAAIDAVAARQGLGEGTAMARLYVSPQNFRERYPEAMARTVLGRLFSSLQLGAAEASAFTARARGRELSMSTGTVERGQVAITPWTVSLPKDAALLKAVPAEASAYLVLKVDWPALYARVVALCDAAFTDPTDLPIDRIISDLAKRQGVDVRKDILDRLQPLVLVHDYPQHPLRLPLMVTVVTAAQTGSEEKVKGALGKLTAGVAATLEEKAAPKVEVEVGPATQPAVPQPGGGAGDFTRLRVRTDADGTSYVQFGLVGPGWGWVGNRLVVSWSPGAVRLNKGSAGRVTSGAFVAK
jgi:hypothetical protein